MDCQSWSNSEPSYHSWIPACDMTVKWLLPAWWKNFDVLRRIWDLFFEPLLELPRGPLRTGWSSISFLAKSIFDVRFKIKKNQTIPHMIAPESLFWVFIFWVSKSKSNINVQLRKIGQPISDRHFHYLSHKRCTSVAVFVMRAYSSLKTLCAYVYFS